MPFSRLQIQHEKGTKRGTMHSRNHTHTQTHAHALHSRNQQTALIGVAPDIHAANTDKQTRTQRTRNALDTRSTHLHHPTPQPAVAFSPADSVEKVVTVHVVSFNMAVWPARTAFSHSDRVFKANKS